jgi:hypothetical protein
VFEKVFDRVKTPFRLMRLDIDYIEGGLVSSWMRGKVTEMTNAVDGLVRLSGEGLPWVGFCND